MSVHVLMNVLNELIKSEALGAYYLFATCLINAMIQEHKCKILFMV